jgi:putative spermidine/putrescine transport system ATP-binding protein
MATVSIRNLRKDYGSTVAVADFSLDIAEGELVAFLGPSGCGKTTTLRVIAGFIDATAGSVHIGDQEVTHLPPDKRDTGMVFQRYALFPHMTVAQNVAFGLEMRKFGREEKKQRVGEALEMVRMTSFQDRYPRHLSGGQQQRVAIARALAIRPKVFLLDEPLSNLDAKLRVEVREEIRALQQRLGLTTIFVTHDQEEAMTIADRVVIMHDGRAQQLGTASELYERPVNRFVADFLGKMNFFDGEPIGPTGFRSDRGTPIRIAPAASGAKALGLRPERVALRSSATGQANALPVRIDDVVFMGSVVEWRVSTAQGDRILSHSQNAPRDGAHALTRGAQAFACFDAEDCVSFN